MITGNTKSDGTVRLVGFLCGGNRIEVEINDIIQCPYSITGNRFQFRWIVDVDIPKTQGGQVAYDIAAGFAYRDNDIVTILIFNTIVNMVTGASLDKGIGG